MYGQVKHIWEKVEAMELFDRKIYETGGFDRELEAYDVINTRC